MTEDGKTDDVPIFENVKNMIEELQAINLTSLVKKKSIEVFYKGSNSTSFNKNKDNNFPPVWVYKRRVMPKNLLKFFENIAELVNDGNVVEAILIFQRKDTKGYEIYGQKKALVISGRHKLQKD